MRHSPPSFGTTRLPNDASPNSLLISPTTVWQTWATPATRRTSRRRLSTLSRQHVTLHLFRVLANISLIIASELIETRGIRPRFQVWSVTIRYPFYHSHGVSLRRAARCNRFGHKIRFRGWCFDITDEHEGEAEFFTALMDKEMRSGSEDMSLFLRLDLYTHAAFTQVCACGSALRKAYWFWEEDGVYCNFHHGRQANWATGKGDGVL